MFPGKYTYRDKVKFKKRGCGIVEGEIIGVMIKGYGVTEEVVYICHSTDFVKHPFYFYEVYESQVIE